MNHTRQKIFGRRSRDLLASAWVLQYQARLWLAGRLCALRPGKPFEHVEPERVLVVIAGLLGDSIMSSPVIVEARRLLPNAEITLLGMQHNCDLFAACPLIDSFHTVTAIPFTLRGRADVRRLLAWLRSRSFDVALIILGDQFSVVLKRAGIPVRIGVRGSPLASCLTHSYDIGSPRTWGPPERLQALSVLGLSVASPAPRLWVADSARASARNKLRELDLDERQRYVAVHPFGSNPRQWWSIDRVEDIARSLSQRGFRVLVIGGRETRGVVPDRLRQTATDTTGAFTLQELLAVIEGASIVITTDSGPFHMAGALGRPTVGLFRASRPEHADLYSTAKVVMESHADCAGCRWNRCQASPCRQMAALTSTRVLAAIEPLIATACA